MLTLKIIKLAYEHYPMDRRVVYLKEYAETLPYIITADALVDEIEVHVGRSPKSATVHFTDGRILYIPGHRVLWWELLDLKGGE